MSRIRSLDLPRPSSPLSPFNHPGPKTFPDYGYIFTKPEFDVSPLIYTVFTIIRSVPTYRPIESYFWEAIRLFSRSQSQRSPPISSKYQTEQPPNLKSALDVSRPTSFSQNSTWSNVGPLKLIHLETEYNIGHSDHGGWKGGHKEAFSWDEQAF